MRTTTFPLGDFLPESARLFVRRRMQELMGVAIIGATVALGASLATWSINDPSLNHATDAKVHNVLGVHGAIVADLVMQLVGVSSIALLAPLGFFGWRVAIHQPTHAGKLRLGYWLLGIIASAALASLLPNTERWPLPTGMGGVIGDAVLSLPRLYFSGAGLALTALVLGVTAIFSLSIAAGFGHLPQREKPAASDMRSGLRAEKEPLFRRALAALKRLAVWKRAAPIDRREPQVGFAFDRQETAGPDPFLGAEAPSRSARRAAHESASRVADGPFGLPETGLLNPPKVGPRAFSQETLEQGASALESVLEDFSVKGDIVSVHPGPVVTLFEFEPAPGVKSSRVIGLADDIARSMSAVSARVAVVPGRNAIGIELPNARRETVFLRELIASPDFSDSKHRLAIALGKTIGGEPVIVDLAKMPHLLVAGTTGSGKSVAINTMILSLLYRLKPQECRLIMVDPKMLELSVYDGIPHLLTPVVTDPKKAVVALKWAVREMEDRYKKMSKLGVRNIDGFNARVTEATAKGEVITRTVQTGFDRETGEAIYEQEQMDLSTLPYIVVIVDEMADLMMVAGKEIEGAIQRLAQMARAAGIHLIMATQRPSVDVITGTIKANFPTRISFQVTSKIDSRTILGEMGAEQLLGQGDMLYMAGGGRIVRVHGPFVSDTEVERVVAHLKMQGQPEYLDAVTVEDDGEDEDAPLPMGDEEGGDLYDRAVAVVLRDKKCSTSYVQRRLQIGYNKAASLVERMEKEGVVGPANHAGKRQILVGGDVD
ncbi:S-DNA-T family DNA segregation ATPase FtsK/SpoIIIE [Rhodoblastus acidophilus]|uniref:DNA translocase FtsK n=1 Tax=Rhodoblastus acidophilus TaxID=1074 RepID=UPI0022256798|nr:DNA translocase FtsK [Rhodoblastus acidophilus]MCW2285208.1 S-DNA-T family DNA segregation ATPase FtsK/SpoIIIE [Rhodoblastus acidophilus]MCW2334164.1 S-DNA-T family DNA segregation ATPase FtsK/SpoIIIE [Rhodoblastus acidophilus]